MIQCPAHFSVSAQYRPPRDTRSNYFVNKIFVISRLITKFTKILCHENLELYGNLCEREGGGRGKGGGERERGREGRKGKRGGKGGGGREQ